MGKTILNISPEFIIIRHLQGIKLISPSHLKANYPASTHHTVKSMMELNLNVYFFAPESIIANCNLGCEKMAGFTENHLRGKSISQFIDKKSSHRILNDNNQVLLTKKKMILEEHITTLVVEDVWGTSLKVPFYNEQNEVIGLFGCSAMNHEYTYSQTEVLSLFTQTGLLAPVYQPEPIKIPIFDNLSFREKEILHCLVRGKTAKQIAASIELSPRTVEHYLEKIKAKLKVQSKSELIEKIIDLY